MEITLANSGRIYEWSQSEPSDSYIKQEFTRGFEDNSYAIPKDISVSLWPHCFLVTRFPLV